MEIAFIIVMVLSLLGVGGLMWWRTGYWQFFATTSTFSVLFGIYEWVADSTTGMTISQQWGEWLDTETILAGGALVIFMLGFAALGIHLWSMRKNK